MAKRVGIYTPGVAISSVYSGGLIFAVNVSALNFGNDFSLTDSPPGQVNISLSLAANAAAHRTALGMDAGGSGDIWVEKAGDTMTGILLIESTRPIIRFVETDAGVDEKVWRINTNVGMFLIQTEVDAFGSNVTAMSIGRVGGTPTAPTFPGMAGSGTRAVEVSPTGVFSATKVLDDTYVNTVGDNMSGRLLIDASSGQNFWTRAVGAVSNQINERFSADVSGPSIYLQKSRGITAGANGIVVNGDSAGDIWFYANDGVSMIPSGLIRSTIDGTPGVGDMPAALEFWVTPDGASTVNRKLRIRQNGTVEVTNNETVGGTLDVTGNTTLGGTLGVTGAATLSALSGASSRVVQASATGALSAIENLGMTLIDEDSFSAVASHSMASGVLTSTYDDYLILLDIDTVSVAAVSICLRLRAAGADAVAANYFYAGQLWRSNNTTISFGANTTFWLFMPGDTGFTTLNSSSFIYLHRPAIAAPTRFESNCGILWSGGFPGSSLAGGVHSLSTAYDSLSIIPNVASNITGRVRLYGIRK